MGKKPDLNEQVEKAKEVLSKRSLRKCEMCNGEGSIQADGFPFAVVVGSEIETGYAITDEKPIVGCFFCDGMGV